MFPCLHLMLCPERRGTMLVRNIRSFWQQTSCNIPVNASSDTSNFRREPAATFLTEASSSHSIHAVAGELKLLEQDWVRNVDLWYYSMIAFSPDFWRCQKQDLLSGRHICLNIRVRLYLAYSRSATGLRSALFLVLTQRMVVIPHRRFGTTYRSYLQMSRIQKALFRLWRWMW
jgi:hypothetical protein